MSSSKKGKKKNKITRIQFLRNKYVNKKLNNGEVLSEQIFNDIKKYDPTDKKKYLNWLLSLYCNDNLPLEDLYKANQYLDAFNKYKFQLKEKDINNYNNLDDLYESISSFLNEEYVSNSEIINKQKEEGVREVYEDKRWKIIVPLTLETSNLYGKGTQWCTTSQKGASFETYNKDGPLYIILDKKADENDYSYHKYQFHFESNQFMNAKNNRIDLYNFFESHPELLKVFSNEKTQFGLFIRMVFGYSTDEYEYIDDDFKIKDFLNKSNFSETSLNIKLHVNGDLYIDEIESIDSLCVEGNLIINDSCLKEIRNELYVKKSIFARNSDLEKIPKNSYICKSADFSFSQLEEIPQNLNVGKNCYLVETNIRSIRKKDNLKVGQHLYAHNLGINIEDIEAEVGGNIYCISDILA